MQSLRCRELRLSLFRHPGTFPQHRMPRTISFSEWWRVQAVRGSGVWVWRSGASALFACRLLRFSTPPQHRMPPTASLSEAAVLAGGSGV